MAQRTKSTFGGDIVECGEMFGANSVNLTSVILNKSSQEDGKRPFAQFTIII